jgi:hypothetical protein
MYKIFYFLGGLDVDVLSSVKIDKTETVDDLKKKIKDENSVALAGVDAGSLNLYPTSIPTDNPNYMEQVNNEFKRLSKLKPLVPTIELEMVFPDPPASPEIHILVAFPPGESIDSRACDVRR